MHEAEYWIATHKDGQDVVEIQLSVGAEPQAGLVGTTNCESGPEGAELSLVVAPVQRTGSMRRSSVVEGAWKCPSQLRGPVVLWIEDGRTRVSEYLHAVSGAEKSGPHFLRRLKETKTRIRWKAAPVGWTMTWLQDHKDLGEQRIEAESGEIVYDVIPDEPLSCLLKSNEKESLLMKWRGSAPDELSVDFGSCPTITISFEPPDLEKLKGGLAAIEGTLQFAQLEPLNGLMWKWITLNVKDGKARLPFQVRSAAWYYRAYLSTPVACIAGILPANAVGAADERIVMGSHCRWQPFSDLSPVPIRKLILKSVDGIDMEGEVRINVRTFLDPGGRNLDPAVPAAVQSELLLPGPRATFEVR
ncbi:MAG: hypothetical protein SGI72_12375 [Planctomycetota bacterium]|nr:hypothetical protein [Planctomycetota bacterium]